ncbi:MAG: CRTAC1 family protein, partial [Candidatus Marinimicrobia bacterium]|nr:CRTAC1 family protein [Candidatus Neomarinimicrobiota bacterium]
MRLSPHILFFSIIFPQFFLDITESSGAEVSRHQSSFFGAGVTIVDYDNDGLDDVLVPTLQGQRFKIFKNLGNDTFIDYSESIGFGNENSESINILVADYDNDGFDDIYVVNFSASSALYHNNGDNTFEDVTFSSGIYSNFQTSRAACWLDYDRDGYIDLYMVNRDREEMNILFHNNGDGTFSDVTDIAGVDGTPEKMGLAVVSFDYDNDHWPDIYIGNDFDVGNIFYRNNGDGTFSDYSVETGLDLAFSTMGLAVGDYDGDDDMDIYVTNLDWGNALMQKNDNGTFTNVAGILGLEVNLVCWGANFFDYDNDADLDLYVAAGCVSGTANNGELGCSWNGGQSDMLSHNNVLFENVGNGNFVDASPASGLNNAYLTTGTAIGDINNDGFYDIYEVNELDSNPSSSNICRLYKNNLPQILNDQRHWVKIKLEGTYSNKNAIGSRIYVYPQNAASQMREVMAGESYSSQSSYTISVGLRNRDAIDSVKIIWPSGLVELHHDVMVDQTHPFIEGEGSDTSACQFPIDNYDCEGNCISPVDCEGNCGGILINDDCGICDGDNSTCLDCNGVPNGGSLIDECETCDDSPSNDCVQDCNGEWGGTSQLDECDVCGGDNSSCSDCADVPNGDSLVDMCEMCDNNSSNDCTQDCMGEWGGTAIIDVCEICDGGIEDVLNCVECPDSGPVDCAGECGGDAALDECGVCAGDNSTCLDCNGVPNGDSLVDECGDCVGGNTGLDACVKDCVGAWGGLLQYDECITEANPYGICGGDNST